MHEPVFAGAAVRNSEPILGVLRTEFAAVRSVLEIGSGSAHHAVHVAAALPELDWQTSDLAENHTLIQARLAERELPNVRPPLLLDMLAPPATASSYDAVYSSNTLHIMPMTAVRNLLPFVARCLRRGGPFCYYGPFRRAGGFNSDSNAEFDRTLKARDPDMGLRELETVDCLAEEAGFVRERLYAMPANNLLVIWVKAAA